MSDTPVAVVPRAAADASPEETRFRVLFGQHERAVLAYALRRVDSAPDAADVVAETFVVCWRRLGDVPEGHATRPWLLAVARRVLANQRRSGARRTRLADRLRAELAVEEQGRQAPPLLALAVSEAMGHLPPDDREMLRMVTWEELTPAQVAVAMSMSPATVRSRLFRARQRLRRHLDTAGVGPARTDGDVAVPATSTGARGAARRRDRSIKLVAS